ncbi:MAG: PLDc N-terminal domain-containing protein [Candidatus Aenigmatarchaeota archaeon]
MIGLFLGLIIGILFLGLLIFAVVFWFWMLVDCLSRKRFDDKLVWVIVLIFLNLLGALLYYFIVKRKK